MAVSPELEFSGATRRFGSVLAVSDFTATVRPGVVTGFLGPNGAGKTTSLRMLLGLVEPTAGSATIGGKRYKDLAEPAKVVGAVLEANTFHPGRTAKNHLKVYAQASGIALSRIPEVLQLVGLEGAANRKLRGFSLGMRQRLALATALLGDPEVLILDEPTNGLDPEGILWIRELLRELARSGKTVLVSSHMLGEVQQIADDLIIIAGGRLLFQGGFADLLAGREDAVVADSTDRDALGQALSAAGAQFDVLRSGLTVRNLSSAEVGAIAANAGVALSALQRRGPSLEEAFFDLISGSVALSAEPATPDAVEQSSTSSQNDATEDAAERTEAAPAIAYAEGSQPREGENHARFAAPVIAPAAAPLGGLTAAETSVDDPAPDADAARLAPGDEAETSDDDTASPAVSDTAGDEFPSEHDDVIIAEITESTDRGAQAESTTEDADAEPAASEDAGVASAEQSDAGEATDATEALHVVPEPGEASDPVGEEDVETPEHTPSVLESTDAFAELLQENGIDPEEVSASSANDASGDAPVLLPNADETIVTTAIPTLPQEDELADVVEDDATPLPTAGREWWRPATVKFPLSGEQPAAPVTPNPFEAPAIDTAETGEAPEEAPTETAAPTMSDAVAAEPASFAGLGPAVSPEPTQTKQSDEEPWWLPASEPADTPDAQTTAAEAAASEPMVEETSAAPEAFDETTDDGTGPRTENLPWWSPKRMPAPVSQAPSAAPMPDANTDEVEEDTGGPVWTGPVSEVPNPPTHPIFRTPAFTEPAPEPAPEPEPQLDAWAPPADQAPTEASPASAWLTPQEPVRANPWVHTESSDADQTEGEEPSFDDLLFGQPSHEVVTDETLNDEDDAPTAVIPVQHPSEDAPEKGADQ